RKQRKKTEVPHTEPQTKEHIPTPSRDPLPSAGENVEHDATVAEKEVSAAKSIEEVTEGSSKRAGDEIEQKSAKRQRLEKKDDIAKLKRCLEIVPEDD
nr:hypothetical protein [Tanacetum cinerariifolium]